MTIFQALILGIIQGFTELLPISSSAHLALTPWLLGWPDSGLAFDVALHLGTLIAIVGYFREEWRRLILAAVSLAKKRRADTPEEKRVVFLVIATIPAGIAGLLLEDAAETVFRSPLIIATNLVVMGIVLWAVDRYMSRDRGIESMGWRDAMFVGLAQCLALVPGVSRSGSTITAGRALKLRRESAAVFSFLLSMPITLAAVAFKLPDAVREAESLVPLAVGVVAAALSAWVAIAVLLRYVARHSYGVFAVYRLAFGALIFYLIHARGL
ncbi:MAG TPA: undecaprenyl-diphosphatase UppP [Gemmatimonadaceae bacterium]|nr:undecaprenyl-diphosphatase UppP [Gemmatimonadaceae bacterium]